MKRSILAVLTALAFLAPVVLAGCRVPEDDRSAEVAATLAKIDERLAAIEKKLDSAAKPAAAPSRPPPIDPEKAVELISLDAVPARGNADAAVTIVEYSDFQCPYCLRSRPTIAKILEQYPDDVRLVFKHFPLSFHKEAMNAHKATIAAKVQGKFWEMHDLIFENPRSLSPDDMYKHAETLELDVVQFKADFASEEATEVVRKDQREGRQVGVRGTPAFFVNGRMVSGAQPFEVFKEYIDEELEG